MDKEEIEIRERVCRLPDDVLVGLGEMAALLGITAASAAVLASRRPGALPPRWAGPTRRRLWRVGDIRIWIRSRAPLADEPAPRRRRGRPRKEG